MQQLLLIGEHDLLIDEKNRLSIPADLRRAMNSDPDGGAFYLILGRNQKPWLYPDRYYEELVGAWAPEPTPEAETLDFDHLNFALATKVTWDRQGRMLIPEKTIQRMKLGREITLIGARNHLEIWNRLEWEARREGLLGRLEDVAVRAKAAWHGNEPNLSRPQQREGEPSSTPPGFPVDEN